ncbi:hypothetical protein BDZ90DRAFT_280413 [Jaminaea rosea]|uniref:SPIN90/Ldb17 leucine-rich domain-containing protein n=1 Tax=Jaminaea rosea TaxID=1569628 RepID=A0A316URJ7_9BASI|nr:hypothetical protein BDZ90DRAFT_280413 [Jaminaea rosea]PWN26941.1 hypothetical protein BDZ90DRAFT_280413 [Jaminaea rosea]
MILPAPPIPPSTTTTSLPPSSSAASTFYASLDSILDSPLAVPLVCSQDDEETQQHAALFDKLQSYYALLESHYDQYLDQETNVEYCVSRLLSCGWFKEHRTGVETCMLDLSSRARSLPALLIAYDVILAYGDEHPEIYLSLHNGVDGSAKDKIARLVHQIWAGHYAAVAEATLGGLGRKEMNDDVATAPGWGGASFASDEGETTHGNPIAARLAPRQALPETSNAARLRIHQIRLRERAIQLLYEVCRMQRLEPVDMRAVDEHFVSHLFDLVEETRHHEDEAFNYQLIKVIAALNEQFMVSSLSSQISAKNVVMGILRSRLHVTKTFGENLIFMLNRASSHSAEDACMQLLVLKLLYLLFTTTETAHYFYTNDLKVLVDVFIRELTDLPEESESLRHTYLRVLHPLLTSTQLSAHPYKRPQIRRLLRTLVKDSLYRGDVSATTRRLVQRCLEAEWCVELDRLDPDYVAPTPAPNGNGGATKGARPSTGGESTTQSSLLPTAASTLPPPSAARMRGVSVSSPTSSSSPIAPPPTAPAHVPSFLEAPRFRSVSAALHSAPTTPPPSEPYLDAEGMAPPAPAIEVEDETAMALADGRTTRDTEGEGERSWQWDFANAHRDGEATTRTTTITVGEDDARASNQQEEGTGQAQAQAQAQSAFLQPVSPQHQHRPVARRASHNEFKRPIVKPAVRRPPPPTPTLSSSSGSARGEGLPRTASTDAGDTFAFLQNGDVPTSPPRAATLPALHVQGPSSGDMGSEGQEGQEREMEMEMDMMEDEALSRSVGSLGLSASGNGNGSNDEVTSRSSSPLRPSSATSSSGSKQRRRPPAPPSLVATALANSSASLDEPLRTGSSPAPTDGGGARPRNGRREMLGSASHPGWAGAYYDEGGGGGGGNGEEAPSRTTTPPSSAATPTSSGGRRRPPPPPVDRSTKVGR